jgi:DNA-binding XRE family transcriptional regulator
VPGPIDGRWKKRQRRDKEENKMARGRKTATSLPGGQHHDQYVQLGLTVSYYRKMKGLSQAELAEKVGCSKGHISTLEAPGLKTSVSLESLFDIAEALEVPVAKFFEIK